VSSITPELPALYVTVHLIGRRNRIDTCCIATESRCRVRLARRHPHQPGSLHCTPANRAKSLPNETIPHLRSTTKAARCASFTRLPAVVRGCSRPRRIPPRARPDDYCPRRPHPGVAPVHRLVQAQRVREETLAGDQSHEGQQRHPGQAHGLAAGQRRVQSHPGSFVVLGVGVDRQERDVGVDQSHEPNRIRRSNSPSSRSPANESARSIFTAL